MPASMKPNLFENVTYKVVQSIDIDISIFSSVQYLTNDI